MICPRCETSVRPGKSDNTQFHLVEGNCVFASSPCCCVLACAGVVLCRIAAVMALLLTPVKKKHADVYPVLFSRTIFFFFFCRSLCCTVVVLCPIGEVMVVPLQRYEKKTLGYTGIPCFVFTVLERTSVFVYCSSCASMSLCPPT